MNLIAVLVLGGPTGAAGGAQEQGVQELPKSSADCRGLVKVEKRCRQVKGDALRL